MDVERLSRELNTAVLGRKIIFLPTVGSTNTVAMEMAEQGAAEGTVVMADYQTTGRGRRGRAWIADPGDCLLSSTILRPRIAAGEAFYLTMVPALAVLATVSSFGIAEAGLKWPNDVQIRGRKVAGILTEVSLRGPALDYVIAGIGLNVNLDVAAHAEIAAEATSLRAESGTMLERERVAATLFHHFEQRYLALDRRGGPKIFSEWRSSLTTLGQMVDVSDSSGCYRALAEDVTADGGLVLRRGAERLVVYSGDVTLAKRD